MIKLTTLLILLFNLPILAGEITTVNDVKWLASLGKTWKVTYTVKDVNDVQVSDLVFAEGKILCDFTGLPEKGPLIYLDKTYVCGLDINVNSGVISMPKISKITFDLRNLKSSKNKILLYFNADSYKSGLHLRVDFGDVKTALVAEGLVINMTIFGAIVNVENLQDSDVDVANFKVNHFKYCNVNFEGDVDLSWSYKVTYSNTE